jgi:hydroxymethylbilane synthase
MRTFRIGTRGSALALAQTEMVRSALARAVPGLVTEVVTIKTAGDILADAPLDAIGGKGVFVKDIERQLSQGHIDMAVHSLKDMQAILPHGLIIGACLTREDPRDMLFSKGNYDLDTLPGGSSIGTSSMRRRCQIKMVRPDLKVMEIRGNVPTRLKKAGENFDAVILAAAGVIRLGLPLGIAIDPQKMIPSPGQGIIAVECRGMDNELKEMLGKLDHAPTRVCAEAERTFLAKLGQDCNLPAGALAVVNGEEISITGMLGSPDETTMARMSMKGKTPEVGRRLAMNLMEKIHGNGSA